MWESFLNVSSVPEAFAKTALIMFVAFILFLFLTLAVEAIKATVCGSPWDYPGDSSQSERTARPGTEGDEMTGGGGV
jgi:hypothetical protein